MAFSNTNHLPWNSPDSISFNFKSFRNDLINITFQGDANASDGALLLTRLDPNGNPIASSAGRALFSSPIQLWENSRDRAASFCTSFSFIAQKTSDLPADGITFFLAPVGTEIPPNSNGGYLGVYGGTSSENFVAVEFDTYQNEWDPSAAHIGIDINNVESVETAIWDTTGVPNGSMAFAIIKYDADSTVLSVTLTYPNVEGSKKSTLTSNIVLKEHLPEWVQVGFSASTGNNVEIHRILSWSFSSVLGQ